VSLLIGKRKEGRDSEMLRKKAVFSSALCKKKRRRYCFSRRGRGGRKVTGAAKFGHE